MNDEISKLRLKLNKNSFYLGVSSGAILGAIELAKFEGATNTLATLELISKTLSDALNEIYYTDSWEGKPKC